MPWRFARYAEEFSESQMTIEDFVARLEIAETDPDLEVADRPWFARSGLDLEQFKARQDEIRDRLGLVWGGRADD